MNKNFSNVPSQQKLKSKLEKILDIISFDHFAKNEIDYFLNSGKFVFTLMTDNSQTYFLLFNSRKKPDYMQACLIEKDKYVGFQLENTQLPNSRVIQYWLDKNEYKTEEIQKKDFRKLIDSIFELKDKKILTNILRLEDLQRHAYLINPERKNLHNRN